MKRLYFYIAIILSPINVLSNVTCLNHQGESVDWWLIYQLPETLSNTQKPGQYLYLDANSQWFQHHDDINHQYSPLRQTVLQRPDPLSIFWVFNDQNTKQQKSLKYEPPFRSLGKTFLQTLKQQIPEYNEYQEIRRLLRKHTLSDALTQKYKDSLDALGDTIIQHSDLPHSVWPTFLHEQNLTLHQAFHYGTLLTQPTPAHAKGIVHFHQDTGFWLNHSFPKYPYQPLNSTDAKIERGQQKKGQHAFCMTLATDQKANASQILSWIYPKILEQTQPIAHSSLKITPDTYRQFSLKTLGGTFIKVFAQSALMQLHPLSNQQGIWTNIIADEVSDNMLVESYRSTLFKQAPIFDQTTTVHDHQVDNVNGINIPEHPDWHWDMSQNEAWPKDHAKWGIAINKPISCFGDLNRQASQNKRGGAFFCIDNIQVHKNLKNIIDI
ncbi:MAG: deoxyribonuclease II family protein [Candidatus Comchoanobacterales bacterium]